MRRLAIVLLGAATLATGLILASQLGSRQPDATGAAAEPATDLFTGVPQHGNVLGLSTAPVTVVEYADLQCPYCAQWAVTALPPLVDRYVRAGKVRLVFRGLEFIGPESDTALRAAQAAGAQNRLWEIVHGLYVNQGTENGGWVTEELLAGIAEGVPGLDWSRASRARDARWVDRRIAGDAAAAKRAGVSGTPAFEVGRTGGRLELVQITSLGLEGIAPAIEAALAP